MIRVAAETFSITPRLGTEGDAFSREKISAVYSPLKTTIFLIEDERTRVCVITSHFMFNFYPYSNLLRKRVAEGLGIPKDQVFTFSSHNHCAVWLHGAPAISQWVAKGTEDVILSDDKLTWEGKQLLAQSLKAARRLAKKLVPVQVWWGLGHERRISYNRKGRRADGSTYFMREEDRLRVGKDFTGEIDDDAPVVAFIGEKKKPVAFLTQFTAHPVTSYVPTKSIVFGEYPQVACDDLSEAFGGVPAGFLQGCAGDHNAKGLLSGKTPEESVADATRFGHYLGKTYLKTARRMQPSAREDLAFAWEWVRLPFKKVPPQRVLEKQLAEIDDFMARCERGDEDTLLCVGRNVPSNVPPRLRAMWFRRCRRWTAWALSLHTRGRLHTAPTGTRLLVGVLRLGDVGIVGMPCEPFSGIGRRIKREAGLPLSIPCGYFNGSIGYVPDAPNNGDTEYMSAFYRSTFDFLPYKNPAGDLLARAGARMLKRSTNK